MSDLTAYAAEDSFDLFSSYSKPVDDSFSYTTDAELLAPTTDEFETELDAIIGSIDFDLLTVPTSNPQPYQYRQPPASAFTFSSSESSYDSARSDSSYAYSPPDTASNYSFPLDLDSDFKKIGVDSFSLDCIDPAAFNTTMPSPPQSHSPVQAISKARVSRSSFSDYGPSMSSANYLNPLPNYGTMAGAMASVGHINAQPLVASLDSFAEETHKANNRRKYKCTICPRAFDRAFNLKTHMDTHNPNRTKPFVCHRGACQRAFSRKHDLVRHLTSVHKDEPSKDIGVGKAKRTWCESCGKGFVGDHAACECNESDRVK